MPRFGRLAAIAALLLLCVFAPASPRAAARSAHESAAKRHAKKPKHATTKAGRCAQEAKRRAARRRAAKRSGRKAAAAARRAPKRAPVKRRAAKRPIRKRVACPAPRRTGKPAPAKRIADPTAPASKTPAPAGQSVATGPVQRTFIGVTSEDALATGTARQSDFDDIASLGAGIVREPLRWKFVEKTPGVYDTFFYDAFVESAAKAGLQVMPMLFDPPSFRSSIPPGGDEWRVWPPADEHEFASFAAAMVQRYGPNGTLWRDHPEIPYLPVHIWQVWNEPNISYNWPAGPSAAGYADMLRQVSAGIRSVDPGAEIVTAGLPRSSDGIPPDQFLRDMYAAGARGTFDDVGVHPYAMSTDDVLAGIRRLRAVMDAAGDRDAGLWATELGWATGGGVPGSTVTEQGQADLVRSTLTALAQARDTLRLRGVIYYSWRDVPRWGDAPDWWDKHLGLENLDGTPKLALQAFSDVTHALTGS